MQHIRLQDCYCDMPCFLSVPCSLRLYGTNDIAEAAASRL